MRTADIRNKLLDDYAEYLSDCSLKELRLISEYMVFTLSEVVGLKKKQRQTDGKRF